MKRFEIHKSTKAKKDERSLQRSVLTTRFGRTTSSAADAVVDASAKTTVKHDVRKVNIDSAGSLHWSTGNKCKQDEKLDTKISEKTGASDGEGKLRCIGASKPIRARR